MKIEKVETIDLRRPVRTGIHQWPDMDVAWAVMPVNDEGFHAIRIKVTWQRKIEATAEFGIDAIQFARLDPDDFATRMIMELAKKTVLSALREAHVVSSDATDEEVLAHSLDATENKTN